MARFHDVKLRGSYELFKTKTVELGWIVSITEHTQFYLEGQWIIRSNRQGGTRTPDQRIRSAMLYPTELLAQVVK